MNFHCKLPYIKNNSLETYIWSEYLLQVRSKKSFGTEHSVYFNKSSVLEQLVLNIFEKDEFIAPQI